jgi:hypothetical protein
MHWELICLMLMDRQTDMIKLTAIFKNFVNAPKILLFKLDTFSLAHTLRHVEVSI